MSETMRAVDIHNGSGPATSLYINDSIPKPTPPPGNVLVRVKAFGLNRADTLQRQGNYPVPPHASKILGLEFSGIVEQVSPPPSDSPHEERHHWKKGDEVFGLTYGGAYAEYVVVDAKMLIRRPKELSWETAAGLCEVYFTALQALHLVGGFDPKTTKSILWHAGASGVSIAGIQLSLIANSHHEERRDEQGKEYPAPKVFATARKDDKCEWLVKELGATGAINTTTAPDGKWAAEVKKLNGGEGVDLIIDFVGATYWQQNMELLNRDGRMVSLGFMGGSKFPEGTDMGPMLMKRIRWEGSTLRSRDPSYQGRLRDLFEEKCLQGLVEGKLAANIETVMKWEDIVKAHELMESNKTKGKIICVIGE